MNKKYNGGKVYGKREEIPVDFYHTWIYEYILNTNWFIWIIIIFVLGGNIVSPIILWFLLSGKRLPFSQKRLDQGTTEVKQE